MHVSRRFIGCAAALAFMLVVAAARAEKPAYPPTKAEPVTDTVQGVSITDPYRWLEKADDAAVQAWTEQQNAFTRGQLDRFKGPREQLTKRLEQLLSANVGSPPTRYGNRYFFTRREGLANHPILYAREEKYDAEPKVVLDPNKFSEDGTVALDWWQPSPDGEFVAYGKSAGGTERSTLYLYSIRTGATTALSIPNTRACSIAWDADSTGFLYSRYPQKGDVPPGDENYFRSIFHHKFGTRWENDPKLWGDGRPKEEWPNCNNSADDAYQLLGVSQGWAKNDLYVRKMGEADFRPVAVDLEGVFEGDTYKDRLYIRTSFEAPRYRILVAPPDKPGRDSWKEIVPQSEGVIEGMTIVGGKLVLHMMENAHSRIVIHDLDGKRESEIELPTLGSVRGLTGRPGEPEFFFSFESYAYPTTVFRYDMTEGKLAAIDRLDVGDTKLDDFETTQVWFQSKDGTRVPMFVTGRKGMKKSGDNPTVLYGYGGFDISLTPSFSRTVLPFLEGGGVYAVANIRGGGEFGKSWHLDGRLGKKQNVFDDFIAAGEKLVAEKYTRPERLAIQGGSNGGLLMGAALTQRPDLFRAVVCQVPLLDMLRYQNFSIARLWIPEYGSAEDAEQFKWLHAYSPYHHVKAGEKYPAVLFVTADGDSRVDPLHARKMAALLQAQSGSDNPVLLWVESKAGHGAGKPLSKQIASAVDTWTFMMWQLGMIHGEQ